MCIVIVSLLEDLLRSSDNISYYSLWQNLLYINRLLEVLLLRRTCAPMTYYAYSNYYERHPARR